MTDDKARQSQINLGVAMARLGEALCEPSTNSLVIDGTIQRFEFVIELFWKTLRRLLSLEGIQASTPKETLDEAYRIGWLKDEAAWLQMLADRNATSHIYNEEMAERIYQNIRRNYSELEDTLALLTRKYPVA